MSLICSIVCVGAIGSGDDCAFARARTKEASSDLFRSKSWSNVTSEAHLTAVIFQSD